jgi:hypothetical protein
VAADVGDHGRDVGVAEGVHHLLGACRRIVLEPLRVGGRGRVLDRIEVETLAHSSETEFVDEPCRLGGVRRRCDNCDLITGFDRRRRDELGHDWYL